MVEGGGRDGREVPQRIPLDFLQGDKFRQAADNYIRPLLTKGVPSLFSYLSSLYNHPGK
ncbi:N-terminal acetyltransferase A, auxiliary subunit, partial [Sesbania bispinosa]